ncbi:MAG: CRTAC1 family protein, partial [Bacteroidetes bacterium]
MLPPSETGITFANVITENARYNIIDFEYVYNGGGVALADMNGDGLQDIFFTGNQVDNALYLNRGDFHFEDITSAAGVAAPGKWCSGAALADVNNDGRTDIYVCANMELNAAARANLLYINQGNDAQGRPLFKDMAALCGVADTGYSTQAVFFDYDNDNDLDLYVVTNQVEGILPNNYRPKFVNGEAKNTDRLFRNEGPAADGLPRFTLVSREAGILKEGYGLSVAVVDINFDGWRDLYVTNDYLSDDLLWINQKDGTFKDEAARYLKHTCHSAMGNDVADINGDGLPDIVALDMLPNDNERRKRMIPANNYQRYVNNETYGYQYQYVRNMLQLHNGFLPETGEMLPFSDVGFLAGTFSTDWSWSSLMADFDNDGNRDLLITNGFPKDISDQDFGVYRSNTSRMRASKAEMIALIPEVKIPNYIFRNEGSFPLKDYTQEWGLAQPSFTNGAAYGDLDNDGDLDLVMNNIDDPAFVYRNTLNERKDDSPSWLRLRLTGEAQNPSAFGAKVWLYAAGKSWYHEYSPYRGYLSSVEPYLHVGLGKVAKLDSLRIIWPDGTCEKRSDVPVNQVLELKRSDASATCEPPLPVHKALFQSVAAATGLRYLHQEQDFVDFNIQRTLPHKLSEEGPQMCSGDVNGDGLEDLCIGASVGYNTTLFIQDAKGQFTRQEISEGRAKMQ